MYLAVFRREIAVVQAGTDDRIGSDNQIDRARVLEVRIRSPPAESYQTFGSFRSGNQRRNRLLQNAFSG
jgi:hypothetical protein